MADLVGPVSDPAPLPHDFANPLDATHRCVCPIHSGASGSLLACTSRSNDWTSWMWPATAGIRFNAASSRSSAEVTRVGQRNVHRLVRGSPGRVRKRLCVFRQSPARDGLYRDLTDVCDSCRNLVEKLLRRCRNGRRCQALRGGPFERQHDGTAFPHFMYACDSSSASVAPAVPATALSCHSRGR